MGMLALKRLMSTLSERRRRCQIRASSSDGCVSSSVAKRKEVCQDDDASPGGKRLRYSGPNLPEVPCQLQRLSCLTVSFCGMLYVIEIKAPNLRIIKLDVPKVERLSLGVSVELKRLHICSPGFTSYARSKLLSKVPNLESLSLKLIDEVPPPDMLPSKFLHLKGLGLSLPGWVVPPSYDYFSLVSLLDSCPSLETLYLNVSHDCAGHEANSEDPSCPRKMPGQHHGNLKSVTILGFCSATSLVELTCYIIEMAASLERLTLNVHGECGVIASGTRMPMYKGMLAEAPRTLLAIRK